MSLTVHFFLQNSEGVLRHTTEWRSQGYVIYSLKLGFQEPTRTYYPGGVTPARDAHAILIVLRHPLRLVDGRFRIPSKHPKHAYENNGG